MICTPTVPPAIPPARSNRPILKSTLPRRKCARVPDVEAPTIWLESEAAATVGGMPNIIRSGVIRNPPPTPKMPDSRPTPPPKPKITSMLTLFPAIGRYRWSGMLMTVALSFAEDFAFCGGLPARPDTLYDAEFCGFAPYPVPNEGSHHRDTQLSPELSGSVRRTG